MLSLKEFKSFEVTNLKLVSGGEDTPTSHTGNSDYITDNGEFFIGQNRIGCKCPGRDAYSNECCD